ncbi:hypothetical protein DPMN_124648 [Dreissena polymorpha]|uniref:Uncharacterized protein n=1 Tax=Dreissena polymorpha TaxID=45954 RepID=A0A9D4GSI2_DREPO|nr:hypothetical protein DPMN_124648 [Dreissena polymorpha]
MRRCTIVSQTGGVPAGDAQTVCDGAKTIRVPALDFHTVCDAARSLSDRRGTCRRLPDSLRRCQDSLSDRRGTCKTLIDSLRRCQDHLGTCRRPRDSVQRCQKVYQTGDTPLGDPQSVCDGAQTVWAPAVDTHYSL